MFRRVPGVDRRARVRVQADASEGQFDGVRLAHDNRAQAAERANQEPLVLPALRQFAPGAGADRQALDPVQVLDRHGDAGQRSRILAACHGRVHRVRLAARSLGVEDDIGTEVGSFVAANRFFDQ